MIQRVRYNFVPVVINVLLGVSFAVAASLLRRSDATLSTVLFVVGGVIGFGGWVFPWRDAFRVEGDMLVVPAVLGPLKRRFELGVVSCSERRILAHERPIGASAAWCRAGEWRLLVEAIARAQGEPGRRR